MKNVVRQTPFHASILLKFQGYGMLRYLYRKVSSIFSPPAEGAAAQTREIEKQCDAYIDAKYVLVDTVSVVPAWTNNVQVPAPEIASDSKSECLRKHDIDFASEQRLGEGDLNFADGKASAGKQEL